MFYYLETFDVSNPGGGMPRIGPPVLLSANRSEIDELLDDTGESGLVGDGLNISTTAFSGDGSMLLVGSSKDAYLMDATGRVVQRFAAASESTSGIAAVDFADQDRAVAIGWKEGYASIHRRLTPSTLVVGLEPVANSKALADYRSVGTSVQMESAASLVMSSGALLPNASVDPNQHLTALAFVRYDNGTELNASSSVVLTVDKPNLVMINGLDIHILPNAPTGSQIVLTATYDEPAHRLTATANLTVGNATPTPTPTPTPTSTPTPTEIPPTTTLTATATTTPTPTPPSLQAIAEAILGRRPATSIFDRNRDGVLDAADLATMP